MDKRPGYNNTMFIKDLLFPKFCFGCGKIGSYICVQCDKKLIYMEKSRCFYCQKSSPYGLTHPGCRRKNGVDGFMTIFYYNNFLKKIIKTFKYRKAISVWKELCLSIDPEKLQKINFYKKLTVSNRFFLQPIPLHIKKQQIRGFNQAKTIAEFFQLFLGLPVSDHLTRVKETKPQAQINERKKRRLNVKGAFMIKNKTKIKNNNYIIVDDLLTTGRTIEEAVKVLKKEGAKKTFVLTLAKG